MRKTAPLVQIKAGPDDGLTEGQFIGYASVFGVKDSYGDIVQHGAFADSLAEWKASGDNIPVLWGHDMADPFSNIGGVMAAEEDDHGLKVTAQLDLENAKGNQVYRLLKGRRVNQMSFAYDVLEGGAKTEDGEDYYSLDKLKLYEVSIVPIGANSETEILSVKHLVDGLKAGRVLSAKNESTLREARDALDSVLSTLDAGDDQEKATGETEAKSNANDEEPEGAKSSASAEEPKSHPSVNDWATEITIREKG